MPEQTRLRPAGRDEFRWYVLDLEVKQTDIWCGNCSIRIPVGATHARCADDGERLCNACVAAAERGETLPVTEANWRQRHEKIQTAMNRGAEMLLDGLEVESIGELKRLVDAARAGVVVTPGQIAALAMMFPHDDVRLRPGPGAPLEGTVHGEVAGAENTIASRATLFAPETSVGGKGCLGITYDTLMRLPKGRTDGD